MCFSEPVSWATLAGCWAGCAALAATGVPHLVATAGFLAVVGGMQLWEALLWRTRGECTRANAALGRAAMLTNHAEPLALGAACLAAGLRPRSGAWALAAALAAAAYAAAFAPLTREFLARPRCTRVDPERGLVWPWIVTGPARAPLYALFLATMVVMAGAFFPPRFAAWASGAAVATFGASWALYADDARTVGSMWCFFAAFLPWAALLAA
jgi:hypothetical protein